MFETLCTSGFIQAHSAAESALQSAWQSERGQSGAEAFVAITRQVSALTDMPFLAKWDVEGRLLFPLESHEAALRRIASFSGILERDTLERRWKNLLNAEKETLVLLPVRRPLTIHNCFIHSSTIGPHHSDPRYDLSLGWRQTLEEEAAVTVPLFAQLFYPSDRNIKGLAVIVHGLGENHRSWHRTMARLSDEGIATLVYDWRGAGYSSLTGYLHHPDTYLSDFNSVLLAAPELMKQFLGCEVPMAAIGFSAGATTLLRALYCAAKVPLLANLVGLVLIGLAVFGSENPDLEPICGEPQSVHVKAAQLGLRKAAELTAALLDEKNETRRISLFRRLPPALQVSLLTEFDPERLDIRAWQMSATQFNAGLGYYHDDHDGDDNPDKWKWSGLPEWARRLPIFGFGDAQDPMSNTPHLTQLFGLDRYGSIEAGQIHNGIVTTPEGWQALRKRLSIIFT
ncbi:MAG: alpha/beta fold hydrolase [Deltaproteobacteria bacterium]|nr:alpha/beta fold hydrolase [Deltaproteobacteria bacterium]